jgi:toxin-antitoxin system PIN domain toxin
LDAAHVHHSDARAWLESNIAQGWASSPLTQNGCVRILSQPTYPGSQPPASVAARLAEAAGAPLHAFWSDDISLLDNRRVEWRGLLRSRQITNVYLLALAVRHGGRFVTFDRSIPIGAVANAASEHLVII